MEWGWGVGGRRRGVSWGGVGNGGAVGLRGGDAAEGYWVGGQEKGREGWGGGTCPLTFCAVCTHTVWSAC